jgi:polyferredoxin
MRFFCRFLCPLGGALAILDRLHLLNLLKRRPECGHPCHLCEHSCPVRAIAPSGRINMAECFQCLDCQVEYYDDHRCPPLVQQRKRSTRPQRAPRPELVVNRVAAP